MPVDRLAAAQHAYGRIMGLAHQQKYMQNDFEAYRPRWQLPSTSRSTFIFSHRARRFEPFGGIRSNARKQRRDARGDFGSNMEDIRKAARSMAATGEVL